MRDRETLQVIDVVVHRRDEVDDARHDARGLVAQFDADALRTRKDVLASQEVQRAARAAEFFPAGERSGLSCKGVDRKSLVAEVSCGVRLVM